MIPAVAPRYGGPSHAVIGMGRALSQCGVSVEIATTDADGPTRLPVQHGRPVNWQGVPTMFFRRQWSEAFKYSGPLGTWLGKRVANYDVVHIHAVFSHACLAAAGACRAHRVPYVVRPLGTLDPWSMRQKPLRKRLLWHLGVRQLLNDAAAIHYTTASEQHLAETTLRLNRGVVIPLGVDTDLFTRGSLNEVPRDQYILSLGRLHPKKGLELLVEVFLRLVQNRNFQDWRLLIAGDGDAAYVATLKELVRSGSGENCVTFTGWLAGADKAAALRRSALLALPSHQENFGLVVAEALACGTPVLVSRHVNLADEVETARAGWVVPIEPTALLESLAAALSDSVEREQRGAAGRELARSRFTWDSVARELSHLYTDISRN